MEFNKENLEFIRKRPMEYLEEFIFKNIEDYLNATNVVRNDMEMRELLKKPDIDEKYVVELLVLLLDNKFNEYYFDDLINQNRYDSLDVTLQNKIQKIVKKYIRQFIALDENEISIPLYESILNADDVSNEHKKKLFEKLKKDSEVRWYRDKYKQVLNNYDTYYKNLAKLIREKEQKISELEQILAIMGN